MRLLRHLDPVAAREPDELALMMKRPPHQLVTGLIKGAAMLVVAGLLTLAIAGWMQKHAHEKSMRLTAERNAALGIGSRSNTVPPQVGALPDGRDVAAPEAPRPLPSPGLNPTPAEPR